MRGSWPGRGGCLSPGSNPVYQCMVGRCFTGLALLIASATVASGFSPLHGPNSLSRLSSLGSHIKHGRFPASSSLSSRKHPPGRGLATGIARTAVMDTLPEGRKNGKVCVVGSINYDQIVYVPKQLMPGQTVHGSAYKTGFGGKGANQCVMSALMGADVTMVGKLGSDDTAAITRKHFEELGVKCDHIGTADGAASGMAAITVSADGENCIVVVPGANLCLDANDIAAAESEIIASSVLLVQNEIPPASTLAAMRAGKGNGPLVILNAAPAPSRGPNWKEGQWPHFDEMLSACDILCVNESETELLTGIRIQDNEEALQGTLLNAASKLRDLGCHAVIFTLGPLGSCLVQGSPAKLSVIPLKDTSAKVVDTTGAGDAYLGALAAYIAHGSPILEAMEMAGQVATVSVGFEGAQTSYPKGDELPPNLRISKE